jgi:hypothetical protein
MSTTLEYDCPSAHVAGPVEAARQAIWRLFEEGYVDENMATAGLLAVDLGTRRVRIHAEQAAETARAARAA